MPATFTHKRPLPQNRAPIPEIPIRYMERVGARKSQAVSVNHLQGQQASRFLEENHMQGEASGSAYLGLWDTQERLRALIVIKRGQGAGEWRIERYATAGVAPGGFTRLLKHAKSANVTQRVTFADQPPAFY